ncbi:MAG: hypothetical protein ACK5N9_14110, partial [Pirellula sp.]
LFIFLPPSSCLNHLAPPESHSPPHSASEWNGLLLFDLSKQNKILIWQKNRTQKNESSIFLRSIFLPIQAGAALCATHVS